MVELSEPSNGLGWNWDVRRPVSTAGFNSKVLASHKLAALTSHSSSPAVSVAAFATGNASSVEPALTLINSSAYVTAQWSDLDPKKPLVVELVWSVGSDADAVSDAATATAAEFPKAWAAARDDWQDWWLSTFDPSVRTKTTPWEGQLPTLTTDDAALKRTYYMNVVSLLGNARHISSRIKSQANTSWDNQSVFATGGPVCAVAQMIIWDTALNAHLLTLLQPSLFTSYVERWMSMGIHQHLAIDMVSNRGDQKWYAFNDMMVYRAMETLAKFLGPKDFTQQQLAGKPVWQWMEETAVYWRNLTHGCNTPACRGRATSRRDIAQGTVHGAAPAAVGCHGGVYYGCNGGTVSQASCGVGKGSAAAQAITITTMPAAGGGCSLHCDFPAGTQDL